MWFASHGLKIMIFRRVDKSKSIWFSVLRWKSLNWKRKVSFNIESFCNMDEKFWAFKFFLRHYGTSQMQPMNFVLTNNLLGHDWYVYGISPQIKLCFMLCMINYWGQNIELIFSRWKSNPAVSWFCLALVCLVATQGNRSGFRFWLQPTGVFFWPLMACLSLRRNMSLSRLCFSTLVFDWRKPFLSSAKLFWLSFLGCWNNT